MKIKLLAVGKNMPGWVVTGYLEYIKRLPAYTKIELIEISIAKRLKNADLKKIVHLEGQAILSHITQNDYVIALDILGESWDSFALAKEFKQWQDLYPTVCLCIGGPEGLDETCLQRANKKWSLSALTLPHPLVRIVVAEQLYRASTIIQGHPYHK